MSNACINDLKPNIAGSASTSLVILHRPYALKCEGQSSIPLPGDAFKGIRGCGFASCVCPSLPSRQPFRPPRRTPAVPRLSSEGEPGSQCIPLIKPFPPLPLFRPLSPSLVSSVGVEWPDGANAKMGNQSVEKMGGKIQISMFARPPMADPLRRGRAGAIARAPLDAGRPPPFPYDAAAPDECRWD